MPVINTRKTLALLVDLDGVVTQTAKLHARSWKQTFDDFLHDLTKRTGRNERPFDIVSDYRTYVDGEPRYDGVRSFLNSRGISLAEGSLDDAPGFDTVQALGNLKNERYQALLRTEGAEVFEGAVALLRKAKDHGLKLAVISSSRNCAAVLASVHLTDLFDARIDGVEIERLGLSGKPAPDVYLEAATRLNTDPSRSAVIEDAISGVEAGERAGAGLVIGVDRVGQEQALRHAGADIVVSHLAEIELLPGEPSIVPLALSATDEIKAWIAGRRVAMFLDYDGTLTPIVARPELAILSNEMRSILAELSQHCSIAIISGRARDDVEKLVGLSGLVYAGSHGFDIAGPEATGIHHQVGVAYKAMIASATAHLRKALASIHGVLIEDKIYTVAVHYRLVDPAQVPQLKRVVDETLKNFPKLRKGLGKKVYELRPDFDWDKGKAVTWLLSAMSKDDSPAAAFYIGDDVTDQDAFAALKGRGISILVADSEIATLADYRLNDPVEVGIFLATLTQMIGSK